MWPEVWGAEGHSASRLGWGGGGGRQKGLFLSPEEVPGLGSPQGTLGPNRSAARMGGYACVQGEVREGQIALPAGTGPPLGAAEPVLGGRWGRAGGIQGGSAVGDGGKETEGEKGRGSPWSREIRPEMWFCPQPPGRRGTVGGKTGSRGRVLRCARRETGLGRGLPLRGGSRLMGFGSITWSKSGHG